MSSVASRRKRRRRLRAGKMADLKFGFLYKTTRTNLQKIWIGTYTYTADGRRADETLLTVFSPALPYAAHSLQPRPSLAPWVVFRKPSVKCSK